MASLSATVSTRFLIISDTHNYEFDQAAAVSGEFVRPIPIADVLLHCGDLTEVGGVRSFRKCLQMMAEIPAELKLVIAGNHDLSLDRRYMSRQIGVESARENLEAMEIMTGSLAKEAGVTYLEEGTHSFTLENGSTFKVYTSPYSPEFFDWAFMYHRDEDRFNPPEYVRPGVSPVARNPVPGFPGVDIMMTHGPPKGVLDLVHRGDMAGCENLMRAVSRARPKLHCFGHIHEAYGSNLVTWNDDKTLIGTEAIEKKEERNNQYPEPEECKIISGKETLMINAAIMDLAYKPTHSPWLLNLDLPKDT